MVVCAGFTCTEPLRARVPAPGSGEMLIDVALLEVQLRVTVSPAEMLVGVAENATVGA